jgi:tRNA-2-methylthio-N6-dimethylallyladenosine synthase
VGFIEKAGSIVMKKVFVKTFGCQMNTYDSDKMIDVLGEAEGMIQTESMETPM